MRPSPSSFFGNTDSFQQSMASLTRGQRTTFGLLVFGGVLPLFFMGLVPRPTVFLAVAFQLACVSGLSYMRWRLPALHGSFWVFAAGCTACLVALVSAMVSLL